MYYAHFILNKKGPLAKIWLAAHWDKKLTKAQIYETNIESTIETILEPQMKLALRTSGHLLLGICRIYSRKVKYLLADCNEAFVKIKLAFRPGLIDLPKEKQQASADSITLPEKFPEFYINFTDINMEDMDLTKNLNQQARIEDITLKEDFGTFVAMQDDDFGDMGSFGMDMDTFMMSDMERGRRFGNSMMVDDTSLNNNNVEPNDLDFFDDRAASSHSMFANNISKQNENEIQPMEMNDIEMDNDVNMDKTIVDASMDNKQPEELTSNLEASESVNLPAENLANDLPEIDQNDINMTVPENDMPSVVPALFEDQPTTAITNLDEIETNKQLNEEDKTENSTNELDKENDKQPTNENDLINDITLNGTLVPSNQETEPTEESPQTVTTTAVAPVVVEKQTRTRRRRKLIIDEVKEIDSATMKAQLSDTSSILGTLELAPPTRKLMQWKETGGVDKLFFMTSRPLHCKALSKLYTRNMVTKSLADITNSFKVDKSQDKTHTKETAHPTPISNSTANASTIEQDKNANEISVEVSMNANQASVSVLPLVESFVDTNEVSKQQQIDNVTTDLQVNDITENTLINSDLQNNKMPNDLDEFDQFGGPASIFNSNANIEDMLLNEDYAQNINLETTPTKTGEEKPKDAIESETAQKEEKPLDEEEESEEEEEEEEQGDENNIKKAPRTPKTASPSHKKRSYRKSTASVKDTTHVRDDLEETMIDESSNDPSKNLNKRAKTMVSILNRSFNKNDNVGFFELTKRNGRKQLVQKFYSLLVLKKYEIIEVTQEETYDDIIISKGDKFEAFAPN